MGGGGEEGAEIDKTKTDRNGWKTGRQAGRQNRTDRQIRHVLQTETD